MFGKGGEVQIMPGNMSVWTVLELIDTQWRIEVVSVPTRTVEGAVIPVVQSREYGLDYNAVRALARDLRVRTDKRFWKKARVFEREALRIKNAGAAVCDSSRRKHCEEAHGPYHKWACEVCEFKPG
jgi:hypothetical protein